MTEREPQNPEEEPAWHQTIEETLGAHSHALEHQEWGEGRRFIRRVANEFITFDFYPNSQNARLLTKEIDLILPEATVPQAGEGSMVLQSKNILWTLAFTQQDEMVLKRQVMLKKDDGPDIGVRKPIPQPPHTWPAREVALEVPVEEQP